LPQESLSCLKQNRFTQNVWEPGLYFRYVEVKGGLLEKVDPSSLSITSFQFKREIGLDFQQITTTSHPLKRAILLPVAVTADIATSLVQLLGLIGLVVLFKNARF